MISIRYPIIVLYAIVLHLVQALSLAFDPSVEGVTSVNTVMGLIHNRLWTVAALSCVALWAGLGLFSQNRTKAIVLMLPQQFMLFVGAVGAIHAIATLQFADGVNRPFWFLFADQLPIVLLAIGHSIALFGMIKVTEWNHTW